MRCINGHGEYESHEDEGWLHAPEGRPIKPMCRAHAEVVIDEYAATLGERWTFEPLVDLIEERG